MQSFNHKQYNNNNINLNSQNGGKRYGSPLLQTTKKGYKKDQDLLNKTDSTNNRGKDDKLARGSKKEESKGDQVANFVPFFIKEKPVNIKN